MAVVTPPARIGKTAGTGVSMPSRSKSQQRLMRAAAHTRGGYAGVPQSVGKDFVAADKKARPKRLPERKRPIGGGLINR